MSKILVAMSLSFSMVVLASAAQAEQPGQDACARDVSRFCRARINDGDQVVLACLKEHRAKLSKACDKTLTDNGQ
ncbi:MAG: hypothetical protein V7634_942 [Bradyrhizobium sp.]